MSRDWRRRFEINADEVEIRAERVIVKEDDDRRRDDVRGAEDRRRNHRRDDDVAGIEDNRRRHCGCGRDSVGGAEDDGRRHRRDDVRGAGDLWYNRDLAGSGRGCRRRRDDDDRRRRGFCGCRWI
ncbi:hypothetical protein [Cytobacillus firmus]|uniref:hypothetical protein n=1 Tax=Cytobacillus firmus TaxID=1399 RepID=UPI0018CFE678|nr:hypothetical protein [Cytobacillus firmus]MBG9444788.1 hypothetical protein [Cytobacillus firmus]URT71865.1 hypothetical protein NAF01_05215 [Cytobacillus firmus]